MVALEESMNGSPSNTHDGLSGPNVTAESGNRQPNGTDCISVKKHFDGHVSDEGFGDE